jgi:hypothetical protein
MAIGFASMSANIAGGESNVCVGNLTGANLTSGDNNTALGYAAGAGITTSTENVFIGYNAGSSGTITGNGTNNAIGSSAMLNIAAGIYNNSLGGSSLSALTSGINNIAIGHDSGGTNQTGDHNTYIGYKTIASGTNVDNEIAIGHGASTTTFPALGTGTIKMGMYNNYISNTFTSNANWAHSSDERWKKNINNNDIGLDFINDLRTVTYNWKAFAEIDPSLSEYDAEKTEYVHPEIQHGLIAQEVKSALEKNGIDQFAGWYEDQTHADKQQGISESMYVIPLIKAVQELSTQNEELKERIAALEDA